MCRKYSQTWRFSFNIIKSKCVVISRSLISAKPHWNLRTQIMDSVESVNILGTIFHSSAKSETHIEKRTKTCRRTTFGLQGSGISYPGLGSDVKADLCGIMCCPTLTYGTDCINKMESQQGTLVKQCIDVPKRNHHIAILNALEIQPHYEQLFGKRIFKVESQMKRHLYNFTGSIYASQEAMCRNYCGATASNGNITIRSRIC